MFSHAFPDRLLDGYHAFRSGRYNSECERYQRLAEKGQRPEVMLIGCCDSRVAPEVIFDMGPGEIFVLRNVANLVPPYQPDGELHGTSAALEFAVVALKVKHIVVMGHGRCGGVRAALDGTDDPLTPSDFIGRWMALLAATADEIRARDHLSHEHKAEALEHEGIKVSLGNLMTFPCIAHRVTKGSLQLHGAWFDIALGVLHVLDQESGDFRVVQENAA